MGESSDAIEFYWKLDNFCFCDFYPNMRLYSPKFKVQSPVTCTWSLYMYPNGHGCKKYIGIYLKRHKKDGGPREIQVRFKISLMDVDGILCPETPPLQKVFGKDCEWGHNEFIKRNEIESGSMFLRQDALLIVCRLTNIIEQNRRQEVIYRQLSSQPSEEEEIRNVCKALSLLHKDNMYSDMILQGNNRSFNIHRCIMSARVPDMYNKITSVANMIFSNDFITHKFLCYAYTGKLDMKDLCEFSQVHMKSTLQEYGLLHLEKNLFSTCNTYIASTHFPVKRHKHSWKIPTVLLNEDENICSIFISDGFQKKSFLIRLIKEDGMWKIEIKPSSSTNDDVFVRCFISIKNAVEERVAFDVRECLCKSNTWWLYPTLLLLHNGSFIFNGQNFTLDSEFFYIDFMLVYPSGRYESQLEVTTSSHILNTECAVNNVQQLLEDLENLYYNQKEADTTILVGNKEFKVHKCLLCARSPFFRAMFSHDTAERNKNLVDLKNEHLDEQTFQEVIDKLLLFIYCGKFEAQSPEFAKILLQTIDMYMIGKEYEDV